MNNICSFLLLQAAFLSQIHWSQSQYTTSLNLTKIQAGLTKNNGFSEFDGPAKDSCLFDPCEITFLEDLSEESDVQLVYQWPGESKKTYVGFCVASKDAPGSLKRNTFLLATNFFANGTTECPIKAGAYPVKTEDIFTFNTDEPFPSDSGKFQLNVHTPHLKGNDGRLHLGPKIISATLSYYNTEGSGIVTTEAPQFIHVKRKALSSTPKNGYAELKTGTAKNCGGASCPLKWLKELTDASDIELRYWWKINNKKTNEVSMKLCEALTSPETTVKGLIGRIFSSSFFKSASSCPVEQQNTMIPNEIKKTVNTDDPLPCGPGSLTTVVLLTKPEDEGFKKSKQVKVVSVWWSYNLGAGVDCVDVKNF